MEFRYVVLNGHSGLNIYKIPASQTARVDHELTLQGQMFEVHGSLDDAKIAAVRLLDEMPPAARRAAGSFSSAGRDMASQLKARLLAKTENELEDL